MKELFRQMLHPVGHAEKYPQRCSAAQLYYASDAPIRTRTMKYKVFVIEDHALMRRSIVESIEREPDLNVCGQAEDARQALQSAISLHPDIVVTNIHLKSSNGLDLVRALHRTAPELQIIATAMFSSSASERRARAAGALSFVSKQDGPQRLIAVIREVLNIDETRGENSSSR